MADNLRTIIIAVICIIVTAVVSGAGTYLWLNTKASQPLTVTPTPVQEIISQSPYPKTTSTDISTNNNPIQAQTVLENFFAFANAKDYEKASVLFGWSNPENNNISQWPGPTNAKTLENYCQAVGTCLKVKTAVGKKISDDEYQFTVSFIADTGETFVLNPPGGMMGTPTTSFIFTVKKINGDFKVLTPPIFRS